jgi:hypothetical protein
VAFLPREFAAQARGLAQNAQSAYDAGMESYNSVIAFSAHASSDAALIALGFLTAPLLGLLLRQARR